MSTHCNLQVTSPQFKCCRQSHALLLAELWAKRRPGRQALATLFRLCLSMRH